MTNSSPKTCPKQAQNPASTRPQDASFHKRIDFIADQYPNHPKFWGVFGAILRFCGERDRCRARNKILAREARCAVSTVNRAKAAFVRDGLLQTFEVIEEGEYKASWHILRNLPCAPVDKSQKTKGDVDNPPDRSPRHEATPPHDEAISSRERKKRKKTAKQSTDACEDIHKEEKTGSEESGSRHGERDDLRGVKDHRPYLLGEDPKDLIEPIQIEEFLDQTQEGKFVLHELNGIGFRNWKIIDQYRFRLRDLLYCIETAQKKADSSPCGLLSKMLSDGDEAPRDYTDPIEAAKARERKPEREAWEKRIDAEHCPECEGRGTISVEDNTTYRKKKDCTCAKAQYYHWREEEKKRRRLWRGEAEPKKGLPDPDPACECERGRYLRSDARAEVEYCHKCERGLALKGVEDRYRKGA